MSTVAIVLASILTIAIIILVVQSIRENKLETALASLLTILASLVSALAAPELDGKADVNLDFGRIGKVSAQWIKVDTSRPIELWVVAFLSVVFLIVFVLYLLHDVRIRELGKARP